MQVGYSLVYRITQAELDVGDAVPLNGGFIEIVDANGVPTGSIYATGMGGSAPVAIGGFIRKASGTIPKAHVVYDVNGEYCDTLDCADAVNAPKVLGIASKDSATNGLLQIIRHGELTNLSGLTPGPLFLGVSGDVSSTPPVSGVLLRVGFAPSPTVMVIDIGSPINL